MYQDESTTGTPNSRQKSATQAAAERYKRAGLAVIPVPFGQKNPNRPGWQNEEHDLGDIPRLWGNGQGVGVLWGKPSGGRIDIDLDWPQARIAARHILPPTRTFGRPGATHSHRIYRAIDVTPKTKRYKVPGDGKERSVVELLSTGTQSLLPPSAHESGEARIWCDERPAVEVRAGVVTEGVEDIATAALIARNWPGNGARHDYVLAATGYIGRRLPHERARRVMEAAIAASGDEEGHSRLRDVGDTLDNLEAGRPTTGGKILDDLAPGIVKQLGRWHGWGERQEHKATGGAGEASSDEASPTDDELRDKFMAAYPDYSFGMGEWREYGGGIWGAVEELEVKDRICQILEAAKVEKVRPTRNLMNSVAELARVRVAVPARKWDADPDILVCANGALHLPTRELIPHSKRYYATERVPYAYDKGATSEAWTERAMGEVVAENLGLEAVGFLQEFAGYALTTSTEHEIALWLTGKHGGGRSTILAGLQAMLGPRAGVLSLSDIARSSFALTNLPGKTLVTATEQPAMYLRGGGVLNAIISGEPIQVDRKYRDPVEITPRCKIAWAMNELPRVGNSDDGIFRRVKVLDIPEIPAERRDPQVKEDVMQSGAAILNWALDGLDRLRSRGRFEIPKSVSGATKEFREHNDVPALFVEEACERGEEYWESSSALYAAYKEWCLDTGHKPQSSTSMAREWKRLGFEKKKSEAGMRWVGLKLRSVGATDFHYPDGGRQ